MIRDRGFGVLLHPTSLPDRFGIGEIGREARRFIEILRGMGATYWQMLPLNPCSLGNSPYSADSAFAGNPLLISIDGITESGLLKAGIPETPEPAGSPIDFDKVREFKSRLFTEAYQEFTGSASGNADLDRFIEENASWINDYAEFRVLKEMFQKKSWLEWPDEYKNRHPGALESLRRNHRQPIRFQCFLQMEFFRQWKQLRLFAESNGIRSIGDIPIFVALDSADVWSHPELFDLDRNRNPVTVAGVPPDYFSPTGQKWGNPQYKWAAMKDHGYRWWIDRFRLVFSMVDMARIDHFRGFEKFWSIPADSRTAVDGQWMPGPGKELFEVVEAHLGPLPVIAEDLGVITPEVEKLRRDMNFPGMKILQFAFSGGPGNPYLPFNHHPDYVVYTGTHDNNTTRGWWESMSDRERSDTATLIERLQGHPVDSIVTDLVRMAMASVCRLAVIPVQDILELGGDARMNTPGVADGNWRWRLPDLEGLTMRISEIETLALLTGRFQKSTG